MCRESTILLSKMNILLSELVCFAEISAKLYLPEEDEGGLWLTPGPCAHTPKLPNGLERWVLPCPLKHHNFSWSYDFLIVQGRKGVGGRVRP